MRPLTQTCMASDGSLKMELFLREEFRPHRPPPFGQQPEIVGSGLMALGIGRRQNPWLRASHENMRDRNKPCRIVKRSGAKVDNFLAPCPLTIEPKKMIGCYPENYRAATVFAALSLLDDKALDGTAEIAAFVRKLR